MLLVMTMHDSVSTFKKLLVIGDSFARYDERETHWAHLWMMSYGGTTVHFGNGGNNAVNIVNGFEHEYRDKHWDFDGAVFHIPDFYRTEVLNFKHDPATENISNRLTFYNEIGMPDMIDHVINGNDFVYREPALSHYKDYTPEVVQLYYYLLSLDRNSEQFKQFMSEPGRSYQDINMMQSAEQLYNSVSPRWLARANYHALKYFNLLMASRNKPVCFIFNPGIGRGTMNHYDVYFKDLSNIWLMEITSENVGDNHISLDNAKVCAKLFDAHNKQAKIFPL